MPTLPPIEPSRSASGIVTDPNTLERIVPATRRADGTMRKELRIRPGFTPQEDVGLFRSRRQQTDGRPSLPPGAVSRSVPGAGPRSGAGAGSGAGGEGKSKAQKKNEKRKEKKREKEPVASSPSSAVGGAVGVGEKKQEVVKDAWDEEDVRAETETRREQADAEVLKLAEELEKKAKV